MKALLFGICLTLVPPFATAAFVGLGSDRPEEPQAPEPGGDAPVSVSLGGDVHLGEVPLGEAVTWFFELVNTTDEVVSFEEPKTNCTCLEAEIADRALEPGERTHVRMVHSPNRIGESVSTANVLVQWNGGSRLLPLRIRTLGTERPRHLSLTPEVVDLGDIRGQTSAHFSLRLRPGVCATTCSDLVFDRADALTLECDREEPTRATLLLEGLGELPLGAFSIPLRAHCRDDETEEAELVLVGRKLPDGATDWPGCFVLLTEGARSSERLRFPDVVIRGVELAGSERISASLHPGGARDTIELTLTGPPALVEVTTVSLDTSVGEIRVRAVASDTDEQLGE